MKYDYVGVAAYGDVEYEDGVDKWDDIVSALDGVVSVALKTSHNSQDIIGECRNWEFDNEEKKLKIGINKEDLTVGIDAFNGVSPQWVVDKESGKIVGINHIAVGNTFLPYCTKDKCYINKNRGKEMSEEQKDSQLEDLKAQVEQLEKEKLENKKKYLEMENAGYKELFERIEKEDSEDLDLSPNEDVEQDIETKANTKVLGGYDAWEDIKEWNLTDNTKQYLGEI